MNRKKLIQKILSGTADKNIACNDAVSLLKSLNLKMRIHGSHHIFFHRDYDGQVNIQRNKEGKVNAYQVKQMRDFFGLNNIE